MRRDRAGAEYPEVLEEYSGEVLTVGGVDEAVVGAAETTERTRQVGLAGLISKVLPVTLLHALVKVPVSTVRPFTVEAGVTDELVAVVALLSVLGLHFPISTHAHSVRNLLCGLVRLEWLNRLPSVFVLEVERPLVLPDGYSVLTMQAIHLLLRVHHKDSGDFAGGVVKPVVAKGGAVACGVEVTVAAPGGSREALLSLLPDQIQT